MDSVYRMGGSSHGSRTVLSVCTLLPNNDDLTLLLKRIVLLHLNRLPRILFISFFSHRPPQDLPEVPARAASMKLMEKFHHYNKTNPF